MPGILGGTPDAPRRAAAITRVAVRAGVRVMHRGTRTIGTVTTFDWDSVTVQTVTGGERIFRMLPEGFIVGGKIVTLFKEKPGPEASPVKRSASGSLAPSNPQRARMARPGRLWVEGIHDAELVEKVWGDDLRESGIVVERLDGIDGLVEAVSRFGPGPGRPLGILVDHLVPGSKETRIAERVQSEWVVVTGTPYVDVWQAVRPRCLGIAAWPVVPRTEEWKAGVCSRLGWTDGPGAAWRSILASVKTYADLETAVVGAVEELIDHVLDDSETDDGT